MFHLPAYVAAARFVVSRRVLVYRPESLAGPRKLVEAGAREVLVIGSGLASEPGIEVRDVERGLPLRDQSVDMVLAIESFGRLPPRSRRTLLAEAQRVLRHPGLFACWIEQPGVRAFGHQLDGATGVDFWTLEDELAGLFGHVHLLAQMPWQGFSLAAVLDDDDHAQSLEPGLRLEEQLLDEPPTASHYLGIASRAPLPTTLASECLLVPIPETPWEDVASASHEVEELGDEVERLREELSVRAAKSAAAARRAQELEQQLELLRGSRVLEAEEELIRLREELEQQESQLSILRAREEEARGRAESTAAEVRRLREELDAQRSEHESTLTRLSAANSARVVVEEAVESASVAAQEDVLEALRQAREQAETRLREAEMRVDALEAQATARDADREALERARDQLSARLDELEQLHRAELERLAAERDEAQSRASALEDGERAQRAELDAARRRIAELQETLKSQETDLSILTRATQDQQDAIARLTHDLDERRAAQEAQRAEHERLSRRTASLDAEREELRRQVDVLVAEREGSRQLAARVEAELEVSKRKLGDLEAELSERTEEASRLSGAAEAMRERIVEQDHMLAETRSKAEALTAQAEQGRLFADVALDRDRLREELGHRRQQIQKLEERLWQARDDLQREKIENVRLSGDLERLREQAERSRAVERERGQELEQLGSATRELEVERAELTASLRARENQILELQAELRALASESEDVGALRRRLEKRGDQVATLSGQLEQARLHEKQASDLARRREQELSEAGETLGKVRKALDDQARHAASLQAELDVKELENEDFRASLSDAQRRSKELEKQLAAAERTKADLQRKLEEAASDQRTLRVQLRGRERELDELGSAQETSALELFRLRRELEGGSRADGRSGDEGGSDSLVDPAWPEDARAEVARLQRDLEELRASRAADQAVWEGLERSRGTGYDRLRRYQLEAQVRLREQEFMLSQLDAQAQQIWEMTDASDRNAARFQASLAQLEKHKEKVDELMDELEVTRNLLAAEQARALEQERLLASERAKLARAGLGVTGLPSMPGEETDDVFADLAGGGRMVDLESSSTGSRGARGSSGRASGRDRTGTAGARDLDQRLARLDEDDVVEEGRWGGPAVGVPERQLEDRSSPRLGSWRRRHAEPRPANVRMVVEEVDEDDEWPDEGGGDAVEGNDGATSAPAEPGPPPRASLRPPKVPTSGARRPQLPDAAAKTPGSRGPGDEPAFELDPPLIDELLDGLDDEPPVS